MIIGDDRYPDVKTGGKRLHIVSMRLNERCMAFGRYCTS